MKTLRLISGILLAALTLGAADLKITKTALGAPDMSGAFRTVTFDLRWENGWRMSAGPANWDAAWVFVKFRTGGGEWRHATLATGAAAHRVPSGAIATPASDGKGIFIHRTANGIGAFDVPGVSLLWDCAKDGVPADTSIEARVFGLEMVYVPQGAFYAGDGDYSPASFTKGTKDPRPWKIESEAAIEVTGAEANGFYYRSSKDFFADPFNAGDDPTGASFTIQADYPKGYRAIYCQKYETTQGQYAAFLNLVTQAQAANLYDRANFRKYGYTIMESGGEYSTAEPNRACGFLTPADGFAFADWCGLRPMTELEYEKICRGGGEPIRGEYVWGTAVARNARDVRGDAGDAERVARSGANGYWLEKDFKPVFPLNAGTFEGPGKSREASGAAYYGALDMGSNLQETCITVGNAYGRAFTFRNGDGRLAADGAAAEKGWPGSDGLGAGCRGGNFAREKGSMLLSCRMEAAVAIARDHRHIPWGFRGVRTVLE